MGDSERLFDLTEGAIVNHLVLPQGTDMDRILVHGERLERLTRWAGAKQLVLAGADLGYERPEMADVDATANGVATLKGLRKQKKQDLSRPQYIDENNPIRRNPINGLVEDLSKIGSTDLAAYKADSLVLHLDKAGLVDRVKDDPKNERSFVDETIWAKHLDKEIRSGIISAANARYAGNHQLLSAFLALNNVYWANDIYTMFAERQPSIGGISALAAKTVQMLAGTYRIRTGEASMKDHNWTALTWTWYRTDRIMMTAACSKIGGKVIKAAA